MPKVLIGVMEDFSDRIIDRESDGLIKVNTEIEFRLKSVISRAGVSSTYGHYTALCMI